MYWFPCGVYPFSSVRHVLKEQTKLFLKLFNNGATIVGRYVYDLISFSTEPSSVSTIKGIMVSEGRELMFSWATAGECRAEFNDLNLFLNVGVCWCYNKLVNENLLPASSPHWPVV